jgi:hypothetical protein
MSKQSIRDSLRRFRTKFEDESRAPISEVESPLALVLSDVCDALRLSHRDKRNVLGKHGSRYVKMTNESRVAMPSESRRKTKRSGHK